MNVAVVGAWHDDVPPFGDGSISSDGGLQGDSLHWEEACLGYHSFRCVKQLSFSFVQEVEPNHSANRVWIDLLPVLLSDRKSNF